MVARKFMVPIMFHTHWGNIRLLVPFHGIAQIDVSIAFCMRWGNIRITGCFLWDCPDLSSYRILHALKQYQVNEWLLWDRPDACCALRFTCWGSIMLASYLCGISQIHPSYCVLRTYGQYQTNELPLWDDQHSYF